MMVEDQVHSYDHGCDPTELDRLSMQADVAWALERSQLIQQGLQPTDRVVDVGCGPGHLSCRIASLVPDGSVTGVDTDGLLLEQARANASQEGLSHVSFQQSWADGMPLPSNSADFAYARFLLQHVPKPVEVLREMARVVTPGGTVMVVDTDDGGILVHPEPSGLDIMLRASQQGQARNGGDRLIGRKLSSHLAAAGLVDVVTTAVPFTSHMVGTEAWMQICLGFKTRVVGETELSTAEVATILSNVRTALETPGAFAQTMVYVSVGKVPSQRM
jgi:ubiquinone/menaquinone biosynthesis C-methylase UbiE